MIGDLLPNPWKKKPKQQTGALTSRTAGGPSRRRSNGRRKPADVPAAPQPSARPEALPETFWDVDLEQVLNAPQGYAYEISLDVFFNARHAVISDGTRGVVHAHSYRLAATFRAQILSKEEAFAVGYQQLRERIKQVASAYNNRFLNDLPPFRRIQPTTEALSAVIYQQIQRLIDGLPVDLVRVTVYESPTEAVAFQRVQEAEPQVSVQAMDVQASLTERVSFQRNT